MMHHESRFAVLLSALFLILTIFVGVPIHVTRAETTGQSPFLMRVSLGSVYAVDPSETEFWGHGVMFQVGDPDGVDNLFTDGELSFSILSPDGVTHPLPGENVGVELIEGEPDTLSVGWFAWFSGFPVFGEYIITVWDADGLSVTYTTLPTEIEYVPAAAPTITYPPNFGIIYETIPTFTWETYVPMKGSVMWYNVEVFGAGLYWATWPNFIPPDETSAVFNFDGSSPFPELSPGQYKIVLGADIKQGVVFEEYRYIESIDFAYQFVEGRGAEAHRHHMFTVAQRLNVNVDIDPDTLNLESSGKWITGYIQLPDGYDPADIDASTILLNGTISPVLDPKYGFVTNPSEYLIDHNNDGILERMVKFDRATVESFIYNQGIKYGDIALKITGELFDGASFEGTDIIFVNYAGDVNGDGKIDILDAATVSSHWYPGPPIGPLGYDANADFNKDGAVNILDAGILSVNWEQTVP